MKKRRVIVLIFVILLISFTLITPFILNAFIDQEKLKTDHNQEAFESFVFNLKMCLASNEYNTMLDNDWVTVNCSDINSYSCEVISYEHRNLVLQKCAVNNQLFSYENGKSYLN